MKNKKNVGLSVYRRICALVALALLLIGCSAGAERLAIPQLNDPIDAELGLVYYLGDTTWDIYLLYFTGERSHDEQYHLTIQKDGEVLSGAENIPSNPVTGSSDQNYFWIDNQSKIFSAPGTYEGVITVAAEGYEASEYRFPITAKERKFDRPAVIEPIPTIVAGMPIEILYQPALHYANKTAWSNVTVAKDGKAIYSAEIEEYPSVKGQRRFVIEDTEGWEPGEYTVTFVSSIPDYFPETVEASASFSVVQGREGGLPEYALNADGTLTVTRVLYKAEDDIVLPDTAYFDGRERQVTAIAPGAMMSAVPHSLRVPVGLRELRGDEVLYMREGIDMDGVSAFKKLVIPGKETIAYPAVFIGKNGAWVYPDDTTVYAYQGSTAWQWGRTVAGAKVKTSGGGLSGNLAAQKTLTSVSIESGVIGPSLYPNDEEWYVTYDEGLRVALPGIKAGGRWLALQWGESNEQFTGTTQEDGIITLRLPTDGETAGRYDGLWLSYNNGDGKGWAQLAGYQHAHEVNGLKISFSSPLRLGQTEVHLPDDMRANAEKLSRISWDPVPGAERYRVKVCHYLRGRDQIHDDVRFVYETGGDTCYVELDPVNYPAARYKIVVQAMAAGYMTSESEAFLDVGEPEPGKAYNIKEEWGETVLMDWYASGRAEVPENVIFNGSPFNGTGVTTLVINRGVHLKADRNPLILMYSLREIYLPDELYDADKGVNTYADWPQSYAVNGGLGIFEYDAPDITFYVDTRDSSGYKYAAKIVNQLKKANSDRNDRVVVRLEDGDGNAYAVDQKNQAALTSLQDDPLEDGKLTVPSSVTLDKKKYTVTEIGAGLLEGHTEVTSVALPATITTIGEGAFRDAAKLTEIEIPAKTETIGAGAFEGTALKELKLEQTALTSLGEGALRNVETLTSVSFPSTLREIGAEAFSGCTGLTSITLPGANLGIASGDVFAGLDEGTTVYAPEGSTAAYFAERQGLTVEKTKNTLAGTADATANTANGMIGTREQLTVSIPQTNAEWDYIAIVEEIKANGETEIVRIVSRQTGAKEIQNEEALQSRAAGELTIETGLLPVGRYCLRYTFRGDVKGQMGWSTLDAVPFTVTAEQVASADGMFFRMGEKGWILEGIAEESAAKTAFEIPRQLLSEGKPVHVVEIAENAFVSVDANKLTLSIPASVARIGANAIPEGASVKTPPYSNAWFYGTARGWKLTEMQVEPAQRARVLTLPESTRVIGEAAFSGNAAQVIIVPAGCRVEANAFGGCPNLAVIAFRGTPNVPGDFLGEGATGEGVLLVNSGLSDAVYPQAVKLEGAQFN